MLRYPVLLKGDFVNIFEAVDYKPMKKYEYIRFEIGDYEYMRVPIHNIIAWHEYE